MTPLENDIAMAEEIAASVAEKGGRVFYVGGFVRDALLGREGKDVDIEVHGITPGQLEAILDGLGERLEMGSSFGIYSLRHCELDISLPRKPGSRTEPDPFVGTLAAAERRDLTINALMKDVLTGEIVDHFGGREDLERGILRHVKAETFAEDPLRVLRTAQFAARFGFAVAPETVSLCARLDLKDLPRERVEQELRKALLKAERPSVFFEVLRQMNQLHDWFPEVEALIGVMQSPKHHPEGDVWNHTMLVLDEGAKLRHRVENPFGFMLGALCHDFGKAVCSEEIDGVIHAYEHETRGLPLVEGFLKRFTRETKLIRLVLNLTEFHMKPNIMARHGSAIKATNKLFDRAEDPEALIALALADDRGRQMAAPRPDNEAFLRQRLEIYREFMARPHVTGRDLLEAGLEPGRAFSEILAHTHKLRLAGVSREEALRHVQSMLRSGKK